MYDQLILEMEKAAGEVKNWPTKTVNIFHHNDADGLSSGAVLTRCFEREGFEIRRICLEKPYPAVLRKVYEHEGQIFIFADFAGRIKPAIEKYGVKGAGNLFPPPFVFKCFSERSGRTETTGNDDANTF